MDHNAKVITGRHEVWESLQGTTLIYSDKSHFLVLISQCVKNKFKYVQIQNLDIDGNPKVYEVDNILLQK